MRAARQEVERLASCYGPGRATCSAPIAIDAGILRQGAPVAIQFGIDQDRMELDESSVSGMEDHPVQAHFSRAGFDCHDFMADSPYLPRPPRQIHRPRFGRNPPANSYLIETT